MLPKFKPGDNVISLNWAYIFSKPKAGDLVVIKLKGKLMVKRIQKTNDRTKNEAKLLSFRNEAKFFSFGNEIFNKIFVVGDNETQSTDSRSFGWIERKNIIGKVVYVLR